MSILKKSCITIISLFIFAGVFLLFPMTKADAAGHLIYYVGDTFRHGTTYAYDDDPNKSVISYSNSNPSVASIISENNINCTLYAKKAGDTTVSSLCVSHLYWPRYDVRTTTWSSNIHVINKITSVKLKKTKLAMTINSQKQLSVSTNSSNSTTNKYGLQFTSSNEKVVTVDRYGKLRAVGYGKAKITVKTVKPYTYMLVNRKIKYKSITKTCTVTVKRPAVKKVKLNKTSIKLATGESFKLKAAISPSNASKSIKWSSGNNRIAAVSNGKVVAKKKGTVKITAKANNGKKAVCKVVVKPAPKKVKIKLSASKLYKNKNYTAKAVFNSGSYITKGHLSWSSSNSSVIKVTKNGNNAKLTTKNYGTATIKVKLFNGKTASKKITVSKTPATGVSFSSSSPLTLNLYNCDEYVYFYSGSIKYGYCFDMERLGLKAKVTPSNSDYYVQYSSSDSEIAIVSGDCIYAAKPGVVTITAFTDNGKKASVKLQLYYCNYVENDTGVTLRKYEGYDENGGKRIYPAYIDGKKVTAMEARYGLNDENLTEIVIPDTVIEIKENTFEYCSKLEKITWSSNLKTIGDNAFYRCESLKELTFPDSLETIDGSFYRCTGLQTVTFNKSLKKIGGHSFKNCSSLTDIDIPDSVTELGAQAFEFCSSLDNVTLGNGITEISEQLFAFSSLKGNIVFKNEITQIGGWAFEECKFDTFDIPDTVTSIGNYAFWKCENLKEIIIPQNVSLGYEMFAYSSSLTKATILSGYTTTSMFKNCSALKEVYIGDGNSYHYVTGFSGCTALESIRIPSNTTRIYVDELPANLKYIYYAGSEEDFANITFENGDALHENITVIYNRDY